ncbi:plasma-membrane proton-efflux P-type ATPase [Oscillospiraceae bacterium HV4-5-C5C]|nr:plasma-membrane proton-efflux P-type ATPase [Oscillospiraceae bacterium HV4-5-C5C]
MPDTLTHLIPTDQYQQLPPEQALQRVAATAEGLSAAEVRQRQTDLGRNAIPEAPRRPWFNFIKRYWGPMPWLLELAIVLTLILGHYTESVIIFLLLTINAVIGFVQSQHAHKAVDLLKQQMKLETRVRRDGRWVSCPAEELVPGDLLTLKLGEWIPADLYQLTGELSVDQAALTGESLPRQTGTGAILYSGSIVKRGEATALVINTGTNTYFGKTVQLMKEARPQSGQAKLMLTIVRYMMYLGIAAAAVTTAYGLYLGKDILFLLSFIVIFLIGAIPVALPAVMTIVQAAGALELSGDGVLVTRLDCIEDAASIDVFCFDKTGTITQNQLTVTAAQPVAGVSQTRLLQAAAWASQDTGADLIDTAVRAYVRAEGVEVDDSLRTQFSPFSPERRRTEAEVSRDGQTFRVMKGALPTLLTLCEQQPESDRQALQQQAADFSARGYRSIAVGQTVNGSSRLLGLLALADPPRPDSAEMIRQLRDLGIRPLMITGDSAPIAREIAGQVGIGKRIAAAADFRSRPAEIQQQQIEQQDGFAEVFPEDKYQIVRRLQEKGHQVGMTGDGVNDAPALKQAELGTAVAAATDVAKASASMILTQPGLGEILTAIKVSRQTYQRMLTWVINKITKVVEVVILFTVGFFWLQQSLVSLLGMSLLVFANDFATMTIASDRVQSTAAPNHWRLKQLTLAAGGLGLLFALEDLIILALLPRWFTLSFAQQQTVVLLALVFNTQFRMLMVRERRHIWSSRPGTLLLVVNLLTIAAFTLLGAWGIFVPGIGPAAALTVLGLTALAVLPIDLLKYGLFRLFKV